MAKKEENKIEQKPTTEKDTKKEKAKKQENPELTKVKEEVGKLLIALKKAREKKKELMKG